VVGRIGGDEFAVILLNSDETAALAKAAELDHYLLNHPMPWKDRKVHLKAAHGIVSFRPGLDASAAMAEADRAMYAEKKRLKTAS
jgi:diguanylate cyclase (GGDEF)-like protein